MIYCIAPQVVLESFEDGALALKLDDRCLIELNSTARDVLGFTDGRRNVDEVTKLLADQYEICQDDVLADILELYTQLRDQKILQEVNSHQGKDDIPMDQVSTPLRYLNNPDVVLREEDEDGGLLFNPDTNQVKVINSTGLFLWKQFATMQELSSVVAAIQQEFEDVPEQEVAADVQAFLDDMLQTGFIGVVEEDPGGFSQ